jgi:adenylate cyclase
MPGGDRIDPAAQRAGLVAYLKSMGFTDAVMFVTSDAVSACGAAATLLERVAAHPVLDAARASVAYGRALPRDGDYFGPVVNLASRAVPVAEPGTIVVDASVRDALPVDDWIVTAIGPHALKGFDGPVDLFVVARS